MTSRWSSYATERIKITIATLPYLFSAHTGAESPDVHYVASVKAFNNAFIQTQKTSQNKTELLLPGFVWAGTSLSYCIFYLTGDKCLDLSWNKKARQSWALCHFEVRYSSLILLYLQVTEN